MKPVQQVAGDVLIPVFIHGLGPDNAAAPRVQAVAASCIVNFANPSECSTEDFGGHIPTLMQSLLAMMQTSRSMGVCQCWEVES